MNNLPIRVAITGALLAAAVGFAAPALADDTESSASSASESTESWTMPDVTGGDLQEGLDAVNELSPEIPTGAVDMTRWHRDVLSPANWTVCATVPKAGESATVADGVLFGVVRKDSESCDG